MTLYVVRHGRTEYNEKHLFCGRTDVPLSDIGRAQLPSLAEAARGYGLDAIFSSPLRRAVETAEAVAAVTGLPVITDDRLVERDFGKFEGQPFDTDEDRDARGNFAFRYPGGESNFDVAARVYPFLDWLRENYRDKTVMIVSHGFVCRIIRTWCLDMTDEEFYSLRHPNTGVLRYDV